MAGEPSALDELLKRQIGLDPASVGPQLILRAATARMHDLKLNDLAAYERHIGQSAPELDELIEETIVAESWFFRDESPFDWLRAYIRRGWVSKPAHRPLQILSLACAAGEEPYSIAIALSEEGLPARRYHIDAVDISARRLARARRGIYSQNAFRGSGVWCRSRYFRPHSEGYEIDQELRSTVRFIQGNVLDPGLLDQAPVYDVIFCRNLLIYLVPSARAAVLALIDRVLNTDGVLFIGHADRLDTALAGGRFVPTGDPGCFAYRRTSCPEPSAWTSSPLIDSPKPLLGLLAPPRSMHWKPAAPGRPPAHVSNRSLWLAKRQGAARSSRRHC